MGHPTSFPSLSIPSEEFTIVQCSTTVVSSYQVSVIATRSQFSCGIMNFSFSCSFFLLRAFVWRNIRMVINPAVFFGRSYYSWRTLLRSFHGFHIKKSCNLASLLLHGSSYPISIITSADWKASIIHCPSKIGVHPRLISSDPDFIPFPFHSEFKVPSIRPTISCSKVLFPLWDRCMPSIVNRLQICDQKPQNSSGVTRLGERYSSVWFSHFYPHHFLQLAG